MRRMQAKDIDDEEFLNLIAAIQRRTGMWATLWAIESERPDWPRKVYLAKADRLIKRGLLSGCTCGCYGGFEAIVLTDDEIAASGKPSTLTLLRQLQESLRQAKGYL